MTADDAAFSFSASCKLNKTPGFILTQFGFTKDNVEKSIRALDDYTLEMKLPDEAEATSFVLYCLSANVGSVVDTKTVMATCQANGDYGNGWLKTSTAGAGAYKLTSGRQSDQRDHRRQPAFAASRRGCKRIVVRHVAEPSTQLLMLQKGDADIARDLTADQLKSLCRQQGPHDQPAPAGTSMYIAMNQADARTGETAGAPGDQVGDRLRGDRQEHHARHLERVTSRSCRKDCRAR